MKRLFVYGTLCPGRENAHILEKIGGEWLAGSVNGTYYPRGWGAAADFPGIILDAFEDGYDRVKVRVQTEKNQQLTAWVYQLQPPASA